MQPKSSSGAMGVLIIDDEANIRRATAVVLEAMGHKTTGAADGAAALKHLQSEDFALAFLDLKLDGESGLDLLPEMLKINPRLEVVVFTAYASIETAVEAMRRGAVDFIPKPFTPEQIRQVLGRIIKARRLQGRLADSEMRWAKWRWRTAGRCSWMRLGNCRWQFNPSCCACCKKENTSGSEKPRRA